MSVEKQEGEEVSVPSPSVSVIIPTYNRRALLLQAIESALAQSHPPAEILVIDDGSTDGSSEAAQELGPIVRVIRQTNEGVSAARNRGFEEATSDWLALLDSDDLWAPDRLELQFRLLKEVPGLDFVFGDVRRVISGRIDTESFIGTKRNFDRLRESAGPLLGPVEMLLLENFIPTSTALISAGLRRKVGLFDVSLRSVEDRDYWLRVAAMGSMGWVRQVIGTVRVEGGNLGADEALRTEALLRVLNFWSERSVRDPGSVDSEVLAEALAQAHYLRGSYELKNQEFRAAESSLEAARPFYGQSVKYWAKVFLSKFRGAITP